MAQVIERLCADALSGFVVDSRIDLEASMKSGRNVEYRALMWIFLPGDERALEMIRVAQVVNKSRVCTITIKLKP